MRTGITTCGFFALLLISGCNRSASQAGNPQATVALRDGTTFSGAVTKSSASEITIQAPNGETRTYPMSQVSSVQYANPAQSPASTPGAAPADAGAPPASAPATAQVERTIPAGTRIEIRNNEAIDSKTAAQGQTYSAVVVRDVADSEGHVAIPHGSNAALMVRSVAAQGKLEGQSELALDVHSVTVDGRRYRLQTSNFVEKGKPGVGKNKRTAVFAGGGTALGALVGALAGGGKGAAIGAASGAAAGTTAQAVTRGHGVRVPAETLMTFRLEAPVRMGEMN